MVSKYTALVGSLFIASCVSVPVPYAVVDRPFTDAQVRQFQSSLAQSQIQASQLNQLVSGIYGPNNISAALLDYQRVNREINAITQNPWNGFFVMRNAWVK